MKTSLTFVTILMILGVYLATGRSVAQPATPWTQFLTKIKAVKNASVAFAYEGPLGKQSCDQIAVAMEPGEYRVQTTIANGSPQPIIILRHPQASRALAFQIMLPGYVSRAAASARNSDMPTDDLIFVWLAEHVSGANPISEGTKTYANQTCQVYAFESATGSYRVFLNPAGDVAGFTRTKPGSKAVHKWVITRADYDKAYDLDPTLLNLVAPYWNRPKSSPPPVIVTPANSTTTPPPPATPTPSPAAQPSPVLRPE